MKFTTRKTPSDPIIVEFTSKPGLDQKAIEAIVIPKIQDFGFEVKKITFTCDAERCEPTTKLKLGYHQASYRVEAFVA